MMETADSDYASAIVIVRACYKRNTFHLSNIQMSEVFDEALMSKDI